MRGDCAGEENAILGLVRLKNIEKALLIFLFLSVAVNGFASPPLPIHAKAKANSDGTVRERLIGSFFKTFAKTYVAINDLQKFKEKNIKKILKM